MYHCHPLLLKQGTSQKVTYNSSDKPKPIKKTITMHEVHRLVGDVVLLWASTPKRSHHFLCWYSMTTDHSRICYCQLDILDQPAAQLNASHPHPASSNALNSSFLTSGTCIQLALDHLHTHISSTFLKGLTVSDSLSSIKGTCVSLQYKI